MPFGLLSVGLREVDWSNPLTRGLRAFYILDQAGYVHNLADRRNHGRWTDAVGLSIVPTREGLATYFSDNATSQRLDLGSVPSTHPLSLYNMPRFTVATRATLDGYSGTNAHPRLFDKSDGGNAANGWAIYDSNTSTFRFQVNATDVFQFDEADFPLGVPNTLAYVSRNTTTTISGANMSAYVNGQEVTATSTGSNTFPSTTTNAAIGNWNHSTDREWLGSVEYFALWDRDLTDAEVKAIDADIYQMFRPPHPLFKAAATGGDTTVNATTEALTLTTNAASVTLDVGVSAATEALTLTGLQADVSLGVNIDAGTEALALTAYPAAITYDVDVGAGVEALTLTPHAAAVDLASPDTEIAASAEVLLLATHRATIDGVSIRGGDDAPGMFRDTGSARRFFYEKQIAEFEDRIPKKGTRKRKVEKAKEAVAGFKLDLPAVDFTPIDRAIERFEVEDTSHRDFRAEIAAAADRIAVELAEFERKRRKKRNNDAAIALLMVA